MIFAFRALLVLSLSLAVPLSAATACSKTTQEETRYHCPMHPTYISDKAGDCPICGMRLVPMEGKKGAEKSGVANASASEHQHAHPVGSNQPAAGHQVWTCPMDPDVVSDKPGRCPKCRMALELKAPSDGSSGASSAERKVLYYRSPTDPSVTSPTPTKDGKGIDFVPVYSETGALVGGPVPGLATVDVSPEGLRLAGVRTAVTEQGRLARTIRAVGVVRADETRIRHVHTKIAGWIEKLYVNFTGEPVAAGRPILSIYSQELLAAQHEYVQARTAAGAMQKSSLEVVREGADEMVAATRRRLELLDVPKSLIAELDRGGAASRTVSVSSPVGGIVMSKNVFEGQQVEPGMELFTVTDLSQVWIEADIYEGEIASVHVGQEGRVTFASDPGTTLIGKIKYVYPYLNAETRTLRVRFNFANPKLHLKLDSYANVEIPVEADSGAIIPDSAILDTGVRQVVYVNTAEGRFEPRLVKVGIRADGRAQILSGLSIGERVAVKANFLIDSESRLRAAMEPQAIDVSKASVSTAASGSHP